MLVWLNCTIGCQITNIMARFTLGGAATPLTTAKFSTGINSFGVKRIELERILVDIDENSGLAVYEVEGNRDKTRGPVTPSRYYAMLSGVVVERERTDSRGETFVVREIEVTIALKGTDAKGGTGKISLRLSSESTLVTGEEVDTTTLERLTFLNPVTGKTSAYFDAEPLADEQDDEDDETEPEPAPAAPATRRRTRR